MKMDSEKQYVELKVSFIHIFILLVGVILIGIFLFFLGYQAGKSSARNQILQEGLSLTDDSNNREEIQLVDQNEKKASKNIEVNEPSIKDEIKLHQIPSNSTALKTPPKKPIESRPLKKNKFFSIQVGAFSEYNNAKNYAAKFAKLGYPTEINTIIRNNKKLYRVRVGNFGTRAIAKTERTKLEKMENKKFTIEKSE